MNRKQRSAHLRIGEILAKHLDARDITCGDAARLLAQIVSDRDDLREVAKQLSVLGSGKLAGDLDGLNGRYTGIFCVPGRREDGSDAAWFDAQTRKRVPAPRLRARGGR